jgi:arylsulfatase A-like enzyme
MALEGIQTWNDISRKDWSHIRRLLPDGLRYNNMHTTALCSPSCACIITGRKHHSNHGRDITATEIIREGSVSVTPGGAALVRVLTTASPKHI